jgi:putative ABC transport system ATP-binding protein
MIAKVLNVGREFRRGRRRIPALSGVSFDVNAGDFLAFVGPSGSGKTTLLSLLGGILAPTAGEIYYGTEKLSRMSDARLSRLRSETIGQILQYPRLSDGLSVLENVMVPFVFTRSRRADAEARAREALAALGMEDASASRPRELSGGERQKVAIARAIARSPGLLLADEPTGELDAASARTVMRLFRDLNRRGQTICLVTHNREFAMTARTVYSVLEGRIHRMLK